MPWNHQVRFAVVGHHRTDDGRCIEAEALTILVVGIAFGVSLPVYKPQPGRNYQLRQWFRYPSRSPEIATPSKIYPHIGAAIMSDQQTPLKVVGFSGSLRRGSFNSAALRAVKALAPADLSIEIVDLSPIPLYNDDLRTEQGYPDAVKSFRDALRAADGVLIATPEYNYSIPGVLKNAIDWASRPPEQPFDGKPIAILGASPGALGSARAQYHLRQCFIYLNGLVMNRPEVMIGAANSKFDADGNLTDQGTSDFLKGFLAAFADHIRYHQRARSGH